MNDETVHAEWGGSIAVETQDCRIPTCPHGEHVRVIVWNGGEGDIVLMPDESRRLIAALQRVTPSGPARGPSDVG